MAQATLEIVVTDAGGSGVGQPAYTGGAQSQSATQPANGGAPPAGATTRTPAPKGQSFTPRVGGGNPASDAADKASTIAGAARTVQTVAAASGEMGAGVASAAGSVATVFGRVAAAAGPVGIVIAGVGIAVSGAAVAFKKFTDLMTSEVENLRGVSGAVAMAGAKSELRAELAQIRRGQAIGTQLAKFEDARSRAETALYDIVTKFYEWALEVVTPLMQWLSQVLDMIARFLGQGREDDEFDPVAKRIMDLVFDPRPKFAAPIPGGI